MSKINLAGIAQDLFLLNDLSYKYAVGKVNDSLDIYFYRTSLEDEKINLFLLEASDVKIVIPASNEWDSLGIDGLYKITCIECENKFIFREYNNIQTIKSASTLSVLPISDKELEIEYTILDEKIRRFNILNQLYRQDATDLADNALNIIFNDEAEELAEKVPTMKILLETAKSNQSHIDKMSSNEPILGYMKVRDNEINIDLEDKGASYYVVDLKKLNKCFLYQQYITLFYIKTYYLFSTYTDIRLVNYDGAKYIVFINQNDEMIIDMTFVEVVDVLVRDKKEDGNNTGEVSEENTSEENSANVVENNTILNT